MNLLPIKRILWVILALVVAYQPPSLWSEGGAEEHTAETSTAIPALKEFHTVIFKIWHTAWPNKDYDMLAALLSEIEAGTALITHAELPGILREKRVAWKKGVEKLQEIVEEYRACVEAKQKQPLLDAAERLHTQYEVLLRLIRAPLKELDEFHAVLYMLYHHYMPQESLAEVKMSVGRLQDKMAALNKVTLPSRFKRKEELFLAARMELDKAVIDFAAMARSNESEKIKATVETMHSRYKTLANIFE